MNSTVARSDTLPTVTVGVPQDTYNPETDALVQTDDAIDIWLYDTDEGIWNHESRDSIKGPDESGNYSVSFVVDHLTPCNPDWWNQGCLVARYIRIVGNDANVPLFIRIRLLQGGGYIWNAWNVFGKVVSCKASGDCTSDEFLDVTTSGAGVPSTTDGEVYSMFRDSR